MVQNPPTIPSGSIIKKVRVVPVELRRGSLIRAANQTFEYVGFGQGNYSVALLRNRLRFCLLKIENLDRLRREMVVKTTTLV